MPYLVWNEITDNQAEFYGVSEEITKAEKILEKVKKEKYPNMTEKEIEDYEIHNGESLKITYFENHE